MHPAKKLCWKSEKLFLEYFNRLGLVCMV
jgi:hypothetical protein